MARLDVTAPGTEAASPSQGRPEKHTLTRADGHVTRTVRLVAHDSLRVVVYGDAAVADRLARVAGIDPVAVGGDGIGGDRADVVVAPVDHPVPAGLPVLRYRPGAADGVDEFDPDWLDTLPGRLLVARMVADAVSGPPRYRSRARYLDALLAVDPDAITAALADVAASVGEATNAIRVLVCERDGDTIAVLAEWCRAGVDPAATRLDLGRCPWWDRIEAGARELTVTAAADRTGVLAAAGAAAMLVVAVPGPTGAPVGVLVAHLPAASIREPGRVAARTAALDIAAALASRRDRTAVARTEARFRYLAEHATDIAVVVAADGTLRWAAPSLRRHLGYGPDDVVGAHLADLLHPDDAPGLLAELATVVGREGVAHGIRCRVRRADGSWRTVEIVANDLSADPAVGGVVVNARDVTERVEAERRAERQRRWFQKVTEGASDVVVVLDADGRFVYVSPSAGRAFGWTPAALAGTGAIELVHPDDRARVRSGVPFRPAETGPPPPARFRVLTGAGLWRHVEARATNLIDDPDVGGVVVNLRDVTEQVVAEERLARSEQRFRAVVQNAQDVVVLLDAAGRILYVSPSVERLSLHPASTLEGRHYRSLVHPEDRDLLAAHEAELARAPRSCIRVEFRATLGGGRWRWHEAVATNLLDDPAVGAIVVNVRDVSERHAADAALRASEALFRSAFDSAPSGMVLTDTAGRIVRANAAFRAVVGAEDATTIDGATLEPLLGPGVAGTTGREVQVRDRAGGQRWAYVTSAAVVDGNGASGQTITHVLDITSRKEAEIEAHELNEQLLSRLAELHAARDELASVFAALVDAQEEERCRIAAAVHDDTVQALIGTSWTLDLLAEADEERRAALLAQVRANLDAAIGAARRLMTSLRSFVLDDLGLPAAVEQLLAKVAEDTGITVALGANCQRRPPAHLETLAYRGVQVALDNAQRHGNASRIEVRLDDRDGWLSVDVRDDGAGFDHTTAPAGAGLGSIRQLVTLAGGTFALQSEPGAGTTVAFRLPVDGRPAGRHARTPPSPADLCQPATPGPIANAGRAAPRTIAW